MVVPCAARPRRIPPFFVLAGSRPTYGAMHPDHSNSPETRKWLEKLQRSDPRRHLVALLAMRFSFDFLARDPAWSERIEAARRALHLSPAELEEAYANVAHLLNVAGDELDAMQEKA